MNIKERIKLGLLRSSRKHKAEFTNINESKKERFKYKYTQIRNYVVESVIPTIKQRLNAVKNQARLLIGLFDWKQVRSDIFVWIIEVFIEGLILNFTTAVLFGMQFTILTIFAHGALVREIVQIWWRLRINGANSEIHYTKE